MLDLPSGTVTFLFSDIEGSTSLAQEHPEAWEGARARHDAILREAVERHRGVVFSVVGDAFHVAFHTAGDALRAALESQKGLNAEQWGRAPLKTRMGLHTGKADIQANGDYKGYLTLSRVQRVMALAFGGQILLSNSCADLVRGELPDGVSLLDLKEHRLKGLADPERLWQVAAPDLRRDFPPLPPLNAIPNNLPVQLTSFVGRENEIAELKGALNESHLVTLTGAGGTGKTRLSLKIAAEVFDSFPGGLWLLEFAPVTEAALVPYTLANLLELHESAETKATLTELVCDYFRSRKALLVFDNCEHLIGACAQLAENLLRSCRDLRILASSREALGIAGEAVYPVSPLPCPTEALSAEEMSDEGGVPTLSRFAAVRLFIDRVRAVQPGFAVSQANAPALAYICQRLEGIPLALELAAARVKGMTVEQIAQRLDDRFRLLTSGSRTAVPHHQTLQATIEWSYTLLADPERILFRQLSVFSGGWTLEAAEHVSAGERLKLPDVLDLMMRLVDKSLVVVEERQGAARYRFLDTIRQFAQESLQASGEDFAARVRNRHLDYFLSFVEAHDETLRGAEQAGSLESLDAEVDNLRAALGWSSRSKNMEAELRLASGLWRYWRVRSAFSEGRHWLEDALSRGDAAPAPLLARALMGAGSLANYQADYPRARKLVGSSLALYRLLDDKQGIAYCLNLLSHSQMMMGDLAGAKASLEESLAIVRELADSRGIGYALYFLGSMHLTTGDLAAARPLLEESLAHLQAANDTWWVGNTLIPLGWAINRQGDPDRALELFDQALEISTQFGDTRGTARALLYIAEARSGLKDFEAARQNYDEALKLFRQIGDKWWATVCLEGLAELAAHQGEPRRAAVLLGAAEHMHQQLGAPILAAYREGRDWGADKARAQLGDPGYARAWEQGHALTYDEAIESALRGET
jgi:predicted ATPase/class 3 adenylate cyclase